MRLLQQLKFGLALIGLFITPYAQAESSFNMISGGRPISLEVYRLHLIIFWICLAIAVAVFAIMFYSLIMHRKSKDAVPSTFHSSIRMEVFWVLIPLILLIIMVIPAARVLMHKEGNSRSGVNIKVPGYPAKVSEGDDAKGLAQPQILVSNKPLSLSQLMKRGEEVYNTKCAACHKVDGSGMPPVFPAIKGSKTATGPIAANIKTVMNGRPDTAMQAFALQLNDDDIAAVVTYERNAFGNADTQKYGKNAGGLVQPSQIANDRGR